MATNEHLAHRVVRLHSEHFDARMQIVALKHLLNVDALRPVAADKKANCFVAAANIRNYMYKQIGALAIYKTAEDNDCYRLIRRECAA